MKTFFEKTLLLLGTSLLPFLSFSQELACTVTVNSDRVQTQEKEIFNTMQDAINQFMNGQKWTNERFEDEEKIECNILITLKGGSSIQSFGADVQVQSKRPVYGTDYKTTVLNFIDSKWQFDYNPSQPLIFAENTYSNELTSLLAFYAYVIIGLDFDTFSPLGGAPYYERALNILNIAQQNNTPGWNAFGDQRDRFFLLDNMIKAQFDPFREALYQYHLQGLDIFAESPEDGRTAIFESLKKVEEVYKVQPVSVAINSFFLAKKDEIINVLSKAESGMQQEATELLVEMNPKNASDYRKIGK